MSRVCFAVTMLGFVAAGCGAKPVPKQDKVPSEEVTLTASDGFSLAATWYAPTKPKAPAVVLIHMLSRDRSTWNDFAPKLLKGGYAVLSFDLRGHGQSTKSAGRTVSVQSFKPADYQGMMLDCAAAVAYVKKQKSVDPARIGIVGASIGANVALNCAASAPDTKGVVLLSPGLDYRGVKTKDAMTKYAARSVMVAVSKGDSCANDALELYNAATGLRAIEQYEGDKHGTDMLASQQSLADRIISFLDTALAEQPK